MSSQTTENRPPHSRRGRPRAARGRQPRQLAAPPPASYSEREQAPYDPAPVPFASLGLSPLLARGIGELGFKETRPIQSAVLPYALAGNDIIASAETGTGKTAAFVIPILQRLLAASDHAAVPAGTRALILAPTRELVAQIEEAIQGVTYHTSLTSVAVYGGVAMEPQDRALRAGVHVVVATPGRLMDHMRSATPDFSTLEVLVLDEADRMMDMGFWPDVQRIVSALPSVRQTLLFSATLPDEVLKLASEIMKAPKYIAIGRTGGPARTITHTAQNVDAREKPKWLAEFLKGAEGPTLIFVRTKHGADRLARQLHALGVRAAALHGDRSQDQRMAAVEGFRSGRHRVLVATDIAARGLDIDGITHVVNYEVPSSPEAYVHRVGRTGRDLTEGTALTLVAPEELRAFRALEKSVGVQLQ